MEFTQESEDCPQLVQELAEWPSRVLIINTDCLQVEYRVFQGSTLGSKH